MEVTFKVYRKDPEKDGKPGRSNYTVELAENATVLDALLKIRDEIDSTLTGKGPVFDTAIVAGVMAAKRTHELIPFCHPLGLEDCQIEIAPVAGAEIAVRCRVSVHHRTGVEMEALTGAAVAALTVYDMCKAVDRGITIERVRLEEKSGGRSGTFRRTD